MARRRHRQRVAQEPLAVAVLYDGRRDAIVIETSTGATLIIPRRLMQGLEHGTPAQLRAVEIGNDGTELYWPRLDAAFTMMNLLAGVYGSRRWMSGIARRAGSTVRHRKHA
jgi:hypothetical protein